MGNEQSNSKELTQNGSVPEKHENGSVNGITANLTPNGLEIDVKGETIIHQNSEPVSLSLPTESSEPDSVAVKTECQPTEAEVVPEIPEPAVLKEEIKKEKVKLFGKMFKKKAADVKSVQRKETSNEDQADASPPATDPQPEADNPQQKSESLTEPESVTLVLSPAEEEAPEPDNGSSQSVESQEESNPEENPVMNFFKTLVTPTKTSKKDTAAPDATKEQSQKESQPAATTTVAQVSEPPAGPKGMSIPPPPPPEPPKMEIKGEPAAKSVKPVPKDEPKAAAKEPESSKGKSAKDSLSKFFRPKTIKEPAQPAVEVQPVVEVQSENKVEPQETAKEVAQAFVEEQVVDGLPEPVIEAKKVDPSKTSTLEAAAKPEPPPPVQEEKKTASKSPFLSIFKPKVADPKKATSAPAAAAEPAQTAKAKEEPKAVAKSSEAVIDNKPVTVASQSGDDGASVPKKLEKRNSIQLFFKNLGQKRHSTDAGVQTEPVTAAPAEKGK
ncbi:breast carcinoma-amplified sequence 1 isoform X2 [Anabas testudineus]|uniref:breast carcinoma-amplified sequence 1 isoform X2 n=1 Tax=Anabas testudineus TaxID=64144 RepID=UPI000E463D75|nr:breast carcinoma-amplified sequence 1 isoform X2 [Anabas testudineus]